MLHPTDPLWEADSWLHLGSILRCGARRPSVPPSASEPLNHRGAPPLCSALPGRREDDAVPLQIQHCMLKEHWGCEHFRKVLVKNIRILEFM